MDFISSVFNYFADAGHKLSHKTILIVSIIFIVFFVDNTLNFSGHYNNSRKYEQIEVINRIIVDSTVDQKDKELLKVKRSDLLSSKTWKDKAYDYVFSINLNPVKEKITSPQTSSPKEPGVVKKERSYWLHFISSSWILSLMLIFLPVIPFFSSSEDRTSTAIGVLAMLPIIFLFSWGFAKLFSYIPIIDNNPLYNYGLNAFIHAFSVISIVLLIRSNKNKKDNYENIYDLSSNLTNTYDDQLK